ncbi:hypothetical protein TruAng_004259 [Truncatella angustata]|nr:hypothetical protein TruAng_004259 [Truncatella angustata]
MCNSWFEPVRKQVEDGVAPLSFVRDTLLHPDTEFHGDKEDAMYVAIQLVEAGSDTTQEALNIMIMAAMESPEAFQKAPSEVDRVYGIGAVARILNLDDMEDLRYIYAALKEILRWRPIYMLVPNHTSIHDI